jgi:hypothetical protein
MFHVEYREYPETVEAGFPETVLREGLDAGRDGVKSIISAIMVGYRLGKYLQLR